jgi:hypothetical protein
VLRGTGRTVATGCGRTASEASRSVTDTERVSTTAFLFFLQIRPDALSPGRRRRRCKPLVSRGFWFSLSFLLYSLHLLPHTPSVALLTFSRQQRILRVSTCHPFFVVAYSRPLTFRVTSPYAKWIISRSWHIIVFKNKNPSFHPLLQAFQVSRSLRVKVIPFLVSREPSRKAIFRGRQARG